VQDIAHSDITYEGISGVARISADRRGFLLDRPHDQGAETIAQSDRGRSELPECYSNAHRYPQTQRHGAEVQSEAREWTGRGDSDEVAHRRVGERVLFILPGGTNVDSRT